MTWIMAVAVGVLNALIIFLFVFAVPKFELMQKLIDKLNLFTRQNLVIVLELLGHLIGRIMKQKI